MSNLRSLPSRRIEARTNDRPPDINKSATANAIRETRARLTVTALRRLREGLFKLELSLIEDMIASGIDISKVTSVSHCARVLEVVEMLQVTARER
jgi:hypothetical protein